MPNRYQTPKEHDMKQITLLILLAIVSTVGTGCISVDIRNVHYVSDTAYEDITEVLSQWHGAASTGSFDEYFGLLTDDAVFLGTDETERWGKDEFMSYAREPFSDGHGWTYVSRGPNVIIADDGHTAWIDEVLDHEKYGVLRGTGVLVNINNTWKIAHYSLTFLVPNDIAGEVVELIQN